MKNTKEQTRHELYSYLETRFGVLDKKTHQVIKKLILDHEGADTASNAKYAPKVAFTKNKIESYLAKIKKVPLLTERIQGNKETLQQCLLWLNSDAE